MLLSPNKNLKKRYADRIANQVDQIRAIITETPGLTVREAVSRMTDFGPWKDVEGAVKAAGEKLRRGTIRGLTLRHDGRANRCYTLEYARTITKVA